MSETNEEYMSQEKLDSILSETHDYIPSQKELDTNFTAKQRKKDD